MTYIESVNHRFSKPPLQ